MIRFEGRGVVVECKPIFRAKSKKFNFRSFFAVIKLGKTQQAVWTWSSEVFILSGREPEVWTATVLPGDRFFVWVKAISR